MSEVGVAAKTAALVAPKNTVLQFGLVLKLFPIMLTVVPAGPDVGENEVMIGGEMNLNPARDAVPPGVVMLTSSDFPPPTMAVRLVSEIGVNEAATVPPKLT